MEETQTPNSKHRKKFIGALIVVVFFGIAIAVVAKILRSPAEGTITPSVPASSPKEVKKPGKYSGKYISFTYPANYKIIPSKKSGNFLEVVSLFSTDHTNKHIAIGVLRELLDNDSGVTFRKGHPETYKEKSVSPNELVFIKDKGGSEYTGFLQHGDLVISVSINANSKRDLSSDYSTIAKSLKLN